MIVPLKDFPILFPQLNIFTLPFNDSATYPLYSKLKFPPFIPEKPLQIQRFEQTVMIFSQNEDSYYSDKKSMIL